MLLKLIIGILMGIQISISFGQDYANEIYFDEDQYFALNKRLLNNYKEYTSYGNYKDGKKDGLWQDISIDNIVYKKGHYNNDKPIGLWQIYYPDGILRISFLFNNYGNLQKWSRYYNNVKIVEVSFSNKTSPSLISSLFEYENLIFTAELRQYETKVTHTQSERINSYSHYYSYMDVISNLNNFITIIKQKNGNCGIDYWHQNGLLWKRYSFSNGKESYKVSYQYKNKKLKKKRFYKSGKLIKCEIFDRKGNKIKEEFINH